MTDDYFNIVVWEEFGAAEIKTEMTKESKTVRVRDSLDKYFDFDVTYRGKDDNVIENISDIRNVVLRLKHTQVIRRKIVNEENEKFKTEIENQQKSIANYQARRNEIYLLLDDGILPRAEIEKWRKEINVISDSITILSDEIRRMRKLI